MRTAEYEAGYADGHAEADRKASAAISSLTREIERLNDIIAARMFGPLTPR